MSIISRTESPSISVVITNHNNGNLIAECIHSVLSQTQLPHEIIIVDDGSNDSSLNIIKNFTNQSPRIRAIYTANHGQVAATAAGIAAAKSEVVSLLDGDDFYYPEHIATVSRRWTELGEPDAMYCRFSMVGKEHLIAERKARYKGVDPLFIMGPIDIEAVYDWGYTTALSFFLPGHFLGNVTSTLSFATEHAKMLPAQDFAKIASVADNRDADYFFLYASSLNGGRRAYYPDRTVAYRLRQNSMSSKYVNSQNATQAYLYLRRRYLVEDWLRMRQNTSREHMRKLLTLELATAPNPSKGHIRLYRCARKLARQSQPCSNTAKDWLRRKAHALRLFFYRKGLDSFGNR